MSFFSRIGQVVLFPIKFVAQVINELKFVTWPSRKDVINSTLIVVLFSLFVGAWVGGLDFVFTKGIGLLLK
ncbi:preprotein translocase subunit SecE [Candidatus Cerribacteria bacterium 'Amazon FNV 2010 28 9']|uniref:Protein translocase subunit SecE n=1 Tax=Candidatus Cerribacteria bacterium 'Amazon FNV 2010 28 9' TaxID=2081795 RepID=A0A317JQ12_9BACT|nr:MAG: preprotein translocase subunit SecE [Candidatus Cerribacteria bacterium 'Amazon FNV 2010 28 9']